MKQFFESYGGVALGILALLVLIAMITPVGNIIKTSLQGTTNKFASSMNGQLDDAMVATAEAQESATEGPLSLKRINKNGVIGDFSTKGNLVEINETQYRVLEVNGTQAKVMSMISFKNSTFNSNNNTYAGSLLDTYLNETYYNSLPETIRNAIVEQNINQTKYAWNTGIIPNVSFKSWYKSDFLESDTRGTAYYVIRENENNVGNRYIYILDIDDVINYLGTDKTPQDVNELFWNQRKFKSNYIWLRSMDRSNNRGVYYVNGNSGYIAEIEYTNSLEVRPAFVIDLSLL